MTVLVYFQACGITVAAFCSSKVLFFLVTSHDMRSGNIHIHIHVIHVNVVGLKVRIHIVVRYATLSVDLHFNSVGSFSIYASSIHCAL